MKKHLVLLCAGLLLSQLSMGQTRKIMHRSHSGKDHSLSKDGAEDDFGLTPSMIRVQDSLDKAERDSIRAQQRKDSLAAKPAKKPQKRAAARKK